MDFGDFIYGLLIGLSLTLSRTKGCRHTIDENGATLSSPDYPLSYNNNARCYYTVRAPFGHVIELNVESFSLEAHAVCRFDSLKVYDGPSSSYKLMRTLCGDKGPFTVRSSGNELFLDFKSDATVISAGFTAYVTFLLESPGCSQVIQEDGATLTSPNYPQSYPVHSRCSYAVRAPTGNLIELNFQSFSLEYQATCLFDSLRVFDGPSSSSNLLHKLCGDQGSFTVQSSGNELYLDFTSDWYSVDDGFTADVTFLPESVMTTLEQEIFTTSPYNDGCSQLLNEDGGTLTSPNYPMFYPNSVNCSYRINAPSGNKIELNFHYFSLEYYPFCVADALMFYDGPSSSHNLLHDLCGTKGLFMVMSSGNELFLVFTSDGSVGGGGFAADVTFIPIPEVTTISIPVEEDDATTARTTPSNACNQVLDEDGATLTSPNYPMFYPASVNCNYRINAPSGNRIQLNFEFVAVQSVRDCLADSLMVYDGPSSSHALIHTLCGYIPEFMIRSSTNELLLVFTSDEGSAVGAGFTAVVTFVPISAGTTIKCNQVLDADGGTLTSPNYPMYYPKSLNCSYRINAPSGNQIEVSFQYFYLQYAPLCRADALMVYDGPSSSYNRLHNLCGNKGAFTVMSSGNELFLVFTSDRSTGGAGFTADVKFIPIPVVTTITGIPVEEDDVTTVRTTPSNGCNQVWSGDGATLTSPNYPMLYSNLAYCTYRINAPSGYQIELNIQYLNVESFPGCRADSLSVYDGPSSSHHRLEKLCGVKVAFTVMSSGNQLFLVFTSDGLITGLGFIADVTFIPMPVVTSTGITTEEDDTTTARTTPYNACNQVLDEDGATLTSPNYPMFYPTSVNCNYKISAPSGNRIQLTFEFLAMQSARNCQADSLMVYDGPSSSHTLMHTMCGYIPGFMIRSSTNELFLVFTSDEGAAVGAGFTADVTFISMPVGTTIRCNEVLDEDGGTLTSPNYPMFYPNSLNCSYRINAPPGNQIEVNFHYFFLRYAPLCRSDALVVYDGPSSSHNRLHNLCDNKGAFTLMSSGNELFLVFTSDRSAGAPGFTADVTFIPIPVVTTISIPVEEDDATTVRTIQHDGCHQVWSGDGATLTSPNYPMSYPSYAYCTYRINAPSGYQIELNFQYLYVESFPLCKADALTVYDGPSSSHNTIAKLCGWKQAFTVMSSGNQLYLVFTSDGWVTREGFAADVTFIPIPVVTSTGIHVEDEDTTTARTTAYNECNQVLDEDGATLTSPNYPMFYPISIICNYKINAPPGNQIELNFEYFYMEFVRECQADSLMVYDGPSSSHNTIAKLCGWKTAFTVMSSGNQLYLVFTSDGLLTREGFTADVTFIPIPVVTSTGIPVGDDDTTTARTTTYNGIPEKDEATTPRTTPSNAGIHQEDDGTTPMMTPSNEIADEDDATTLTTAPSNVWIAEEDDAITLTPTLFNGIPEEDEATTHRTTPSNGIAEEDDATTLTTTPPNECDIYVNSDGATIMSHNFPDKYDVNTRCVYQIEATEGHVITIHFNQFQLEHHSPCEYDYLKIYDGGSTDSNLLGTYCGSSIPRTIQSTGSRLMMIFNSDTVITRRGFLATVHMAEPEVGLEENVFMTTLPSEDVCSQILDENGATLTSPNYPMYYTSDSHCTYLVRAPSENLIQLNFEFFSLEYSGDCDFDSLMVYDGPSSSHNLIHTLCSNQGPFTVRSSGNELFLVFTSDASVVKGGFTADVLFIPTSVGTTISGTVLPTGSYLSMTHCDGGWTSYDSDTFYCFVEREQTWAAASLKCASFGGHLLQPDSRYENDLILTSIENIESEFIWLGITDESEEGVWITDDNLAVSDFTNWDSLEPTNLDNEDCAVMFISSAENLLPGAWYGKPCYQEFSFICEK